MVFAEKHINLGLNYGGLGDAIARAPAVKAILEDYPYLNLTLFVFTSVLEIYQKWFANHPRIRGIRPLKEFDHLEPGSLIINFDLSWYYQLGMHLTDHAYMTIAQTLPHRRIPYLPLGSGAIPAKGESRLVCLTPNFTALSRSLDPLVWEAMIAEIVATGLVPVLLGNSGTEFAGRSDVATVGCIDMRDKTTLLEAIDWIEKSIAVIGIDNGLIHLAACTKTPIIVAYSTQIPENRLPVRNEGAIKIIMPKSACQGCETWLRFDNKHDFKKCYTKTYECVKSFTAQDFIEPLRELL